MECNKCRVDYIPGHHHDPCIKNLPNVKYACCGHGKKGGYIFFDKPISDRNSIKTYGIDFKIYSAALINGHRNEIWEGHDLLIIRFETTAELIRWANKYRKDYRRT